MLGRPIDSAEPADQGRTGNDMLEAIANYVRENTALDPGAGSPESWPLESLDSVEMLDFIAFLETSFGISVEEKDIRPENFGTVGATARYVASKGGERRNG